MDSNVSSNANTATTSHTIATASLSAGSSARENGLLNIRPLSHVDNGHDICSDAAASHTSTGTIRLMDLPHDVIVQILSRLPVMNPIGSRRVCRVLTSVVTTEVPGIGR